MAAPNGSVVPFPATQGVAFAGTVAAFAEIDHRLEDPPAATIEWGDGASSSGTVVAGAASRTYRVDGTHVYGAFGTFQVTVRLLWHDAEGPRTTTASGPAATVASGLAPIPASIETSFGAAFAGVVGQFRDDRSSPGGAREDYAASIDWGDGTPRTPGEIDLVSGRTFRVVSGHRWAVAGARLPVRVFVTGVGGAATVVESAARIAGDPRPAITISTRPCANVPIAFRAVTATSPGAPVAVHEWTIEDPSAFGAPNRGWPVNTGSEPEFPWTFGYSSLEYRLSEPPALTRLFRRPAIVRLRVQDASGQTRTVSRTVTFVDDGYRPTLEQPTPRGCGQPLLSRVSVSAASTVRLGASNSFRVGIGCARIADCLTRIVVLPLTGGLATAVRARPAVLASGFRLVRKGSRARVAVRLTARGRAAMRGRRSLRARLVVTTATARGKVRAVRRSVTLRR